MGKKKQKASVQSKGITTWQSALLLVLVCCLVYSNCFDAPFIFDDIRSIVENEALHDLSDPGAILGFNPARALAMLSFAVNHAVGGADVVGYHAVSLLFHTMSVLALWWLLGLLMDERLKGNIPGLGTYGPLLGALLFAVHPIQTQAVIYIWQRAVVMSTFFYFFSMACFLRMRLAQLEGLDKVGKRFMLLSLGSMVAAMFCKEIAFTLPLTLWVMDRCFFPETRLSWSKLTPFLSGLAILPLLVLSLREDYVANMPTEIDGYSAISPVTYLLTQLRVTMTYLRLTILPIHQQLDYDFPLNSGPLILFGCLCVLGLLTLLAKRTWQGQPHLSFGLIWFFLALAVEALAFTLPDVIFEHRLYLPMGGWCVAFMWVAGFLWQKIGKSSFGLGLLVLLGLGTMSWQRNQLWRDPVTLWTANLEHAPEKARVWLFRSLAYRERGKEKEALADATKAVALHATYHLAHVTQGLLFAARDQHQAAVKAFTRALELRPQDSDMLNARGVSLLALGRAEKALADFDSAIVLAPQRPQAHHYRGMALAEKGHHQKALEAFDRALALDEAFAPGWLNRALVYQKLGQMPEAISDYEAYLGFDSGNRQVYLTLGRLLHQQKRSEEAMSWLDRAIVFFPDYTKAYFNRAVLHFGARNMDRAVSDLTRVIELEPSGSAYYRRGLAYQERGDRNQALADFLKAKSLGFQVPGHLLSDE